MRRIFVRGFWRYVERIVNSVTKVAAKSTDKKASKIGILINASFLSVSILTNSETDSDQGISQFFRELRYMDNYHGIDIEI
jgi:hypothetical protein